MDNGIERQRAIVAEPIRLANSHDWTGVPRNLRAGCAKLTMTWFRWGRASKFVVELSDASFSGLEPLHLPGSRVAVLVHNDRNGHDVIKIVSTNGEPLATYSGPSGDGSPGPGLACWTAPDRFALVGGADDGYLIVNFFEPRSRL